MNSKSIEKDKSIIDGNKLIAEFMGGKVFEFTDDFDFTHKAIRVNNSLYPFDKLQYHSSWDWLMPVAEKIATMDKGKFNISISSTGDWACYIERDDVFEKGIADFGGFEPVILNMWKAIVKFIKWYNEHKTTT